MGFDFLSGRRVKGSGGGWLRCGVRMIHSRRTPEPVWHDFAGAESLLSDRAVSGAAVPHDPCPGHQLAGRSVAWLFCRDPDGLGGDISFGRTGAVGACGALGGVVHVRAGGGVLGTLGADGG